MLEEKLKWSDEEIIEKLEHNIFAQNGLQAMLITLYEGSWSNAFEDAYPGKIKPWEFMRVPKNFWTQENKMKALKWLIEEKLNWSEEDIKEKFTNRTIIEHGLYSVLSESTYETLNLVYPGRFKPWDLTLVARNYWNDSTAFEALKWLFEEKLKWSDQDIKDNCSSRTFSENGLGGLYATYFNSSPYAAVQFVYPNMFKPWELRRAPTSFWNQETGIAATKWMIEEKLKWSHEEIKEKLRVSTFRQYGLEAMLNAIFQSRPYKAITATYPNTFNQSDFSKRNVKK